MTQQASTFPPLCGTVARQRTKAEGKRKTQQFHTESVQRCNEEWARKRGIVVRDDSSSATAPSRRARHPGASATTRSGSIRNIRPRGNVGAGSGRISIGTRLYIAGIPVREWASRLPVLRIFRGRGQLCRQLRCLSLRCHSAQLNCIAPACDSAQLNCIDFYISVPYRHISA